MRHVGSRELRRTIRLRLVALRDPLHRHRIDLRHAKLDARVRRPVWLHVVSNLRRHANPMRVDDQRVVHAATRLRAGVLMCESGHLRTTARLDCHDTPHARITVLRPHLCEERVYSFCSREG